VAIFSANKVAPLATATGIENMGAGRVSEAAGRTGCNKGAEGLTGKKAQKLTAPS
jgi:hypothetical protein